MAASAAISFTTSLAAQAQADSARADSTSPKQTVQIALPVGVTVGGFIQVDGRVFFNDTADRLINDLTIRRFRIDLAGTAGKYVSYHIQPDFAGAKVTLNDVYAEFSGSPAVKLRVGKAKVPFSLERAQATPNNIFVEQGATLAIAPNYDVGVQLLGDLFGGVLFYQGGLFNGAADGASVDDDVEDAKDVAGRVQITPFAQQKGSLLNGLSFGAGATHGTRHGAPATPETPTYKTAGQNTFLSYLSTTVAEGDVNRVSVYGADYSGPVSVLGEWVRSHEDLRSTSTVTPPVVTTGTFENRAYQVYGTIVLTGECASFRGVVPRHAFDPAHGHWGALELVARYDDLKADDATAAPFVDLTKSATRATSRTIGFNWYFSKQVRAEVNYQTTNFVSGAAGGASRPAEHVLLTRLQTVF